MLIQPGLDKLKSYLRRLESVDVHNLALCECCQGLGASAFTDRYAQALTQASSSSGTVNINRSKQSSSVNGSSMQYVYVYTVECVFELTHTSAVSISR
jgi:hypothetical protein